MKITVPVLAMAAVAALPFIWNAGQQDALAEKQLERRFMEAKLQSAAKGPRNRLTASDDVGPIFVSGSTPGLAVAQMQGVASQLASDSGMTVERLQPLQSDQEGQLALLRMEAEVTGSIVGLRQYLAALESSVPYVFVNRVRIDAPDNAGDGALPSDKLTVTLQLESFGWWETAP